MKERKAFGTHDVARLCNVTPPTVIKWMEDDKISFFTTGGGHRRVWCADLVSFMRSHNIPVPHSLSSDGRRRVLVVEDDESFADLAVRLLSEICPGAQIEKALNGFEAAHKMHAFLPELVLLDLNLPMLDGLKVCEMVRADEALKNLKILAVTGVTLAEMREKAFQAGADDFLGKPFLSVEFAVKVKRLLGIRP